MPAVIYATGYKAWYTFGLYHRDGDMPAVEWRRLKSMVHITENFTAKLDQREFIAIISDTFLSMGMRVRFF